MGVTPCVRLLYHHLNIVINTLMQGLNEYKQPADFIFIESERIRPPILICSISCMVLGVASEIIGPECSFFGAEDFISESVATWAIITRWKQ